MFQKIHVESVAGLEIFQGQVVVNAIIIQRQAHEPLQVLGTVEPRRCPAAVVSFEARLTRPKLLNIHVLDEGYGDLPALRV